MWHLSILVFNSFDSCRCISGSEKKSSKSKLSNLLTKKESQSETVSIKEEKEEDESRLEGVSINEEMSFVESEIDIKEEPLEHFESFSDLVSKNSFNFYFKIRKVKPRQLLLFSFK